jgi:hypothetical protein
MGPEVAVVFRRFVVSMVVLACLVGIVQPAIACANCISRTDCCPAGSPASGGEQMYPAAPCAQVSSLCILSAAIAPSVAAIAARTSHDQAPGYSAAIILPITVRMAQHRRELQTAAAKVPDPANESLTYLRTARLRL